jgi:DNA polymerase (family 10)
MRGVISHQEAMTSGGGRYHRKEIIVELEEAKAIADEVIARLAPYCQRIEAVGSIRRRKPWVKDVDIVLILSDLWNLSQQFRDLGPPVMSGDKLKRVNYKGVQVDLYFATAETWATLLLIRTGSKENNIRLCTLAKKKGWHLAANGDGLFNEHGQRIAGDSEESIYKALGIPWQEPWERR